MTFIFGLRKHLNSAFAFLLLIAPLAANSDEQIEFFREPSSQFSSGTISEKRIRPTAGRVISKAWLKIVWDDGGETHSGWIRRSLMQLPEDFAKEAELQPKSPLRSQPEWNLEPKLSSEKSETVPLLGVQEDWACIRVGKNLKWVPLEYVKPHYSLETYGLARANIAIYSKPNSESSIVARPTTADQIEILNNAIPKDLEETWVRVKSKSHMGFMNIDSLVSALDLASSVKTADGKMHAVLYHTAGWIESFKSEKIPVADVREFLFEQKAIVRTLSSNVRESTNLGAKVLATLRPLQTVRVLERKTVRWAEGYVKDHGKVWWILQDNLAPFVSPTAPETKPEAKSEAPMPLAQQEPKPIPRALSTDSKISSADLFKRPLYDLATDPLASNVMAASAQGIYITHDGQNWKKVESLGEQNFPIAFTGDGTLLVGPYQSDDHGATFTPYLRWDRITRIVRNRVHSSPSYMRLLNIQTKDSDKGLLIEIDIGSKRAVQLSSNDKGITWIFEGVKTPSPSRF